MEMTERKRALLAFPLLSPTKSLDPPTTPRRSVSNRPKCPRKSLPHIKVNTLLYKSILSLPFVSAAWPLFGRYGCHFSLLWLFMCHVSVDPTQFGQVCVKAFLWHLWSMSSYISPMRDLPFIFLFPPTSVILLYGYQVLMLL